MFCILGSWWDFSLPCLPSIPSDLSRNFPKQRHFSPKEKNLVLSLKISIIRSLEEWKSGHKTLDRSTHRWLRPAPGEILQTSGWGPGRAPISGLRPKQKLNHSLDLKSKAQERPKSWKALLRRKGHLSNHMKSQYQHRRLALALLGLRLAPTQAAGSRLVRALEPDNGPPIVGAGETKMEKVKAGPAQSTLPLRLKIVYACIIKETKLYHPRLK